MEVFLHPKGFTFVKAAGNADLGVPVRRVLVAEKQIVLGDFLNVPDAEMANSTPQGMVNLPLYYPDDKEKKSLFPDEVA